MTVSLERVHMIGIGGAGMAPLAGILLARGSRVSGSDREANPKTTALSRSGAMIGIGHAAELLPSDTTLVVYSSAIPADNPERRRAAGLGIPEMRRGAFLAELLKSYRRPVAISGSHGKSSVTALLVHILLECGFSPGYLIGAAVNGGPSSAAGDGDLFISEVDESDGTHTLVTPALGVVPNVDDDHSWSVGGEEALRRNFSCFAARSARLLYYTSPMTDSLFSSHLNARRLEKESTPFGPFSGFQAWNARLAVEAAVELGVPRTAAEAAATTFRGIARRMTLRHASRRLMIVEDYAHHPEEVACSIATLRADHPGYRLRLVFQPHRYARLAKYLPRLAEELRKADSVVVTPVFAAWSETGPVDGAALASAIGPKACYCAGDWTTVAATALSDPEPEDPRPLLIGVIGAGDIEQIFTHLPSGRR